MEHSVWLYTARQSRDVSSDAERVGSTRFAFDIGREVAPLVGEIARAVIAVTRTRIGDIQNAPGCGGSGRAGCVRHEAIEENHVSPGRLNRAERRSPPFE